MREIVLDTETTGLDPFQGHRLIEIGCVELLNRIPTGQIFHYYVHPDRDIPEEAFRVHGISLEMLKDKPRFHEIADELLEFLGDAPLVIHNAAFDLGFINAELERASRPLLDRTRLIDTLLLARRKYPGGSNRLDDLCIRYRIDASHRTKHGALLDAELLAEVYLCMTRGQEMLLMDIGLSTSVSAEEQLTEGTFELIVISATEEELTQHARQLEEIEASSRGACVWKRLERASAVAAAA